jgi:hypothetical protein
LSQFDDKDVYKALEKANIMQIKEGQEQLYSTSNIEYSNIEENEQEEEITGWTNLIENIRPYPVHITQREDEIKGKDKSDDLESIEDSLDT